uniref:Ribosomal RNA-processing protein 12-like conserved domain-containing protein n=1 Tax=Palpitomonas bilix TaxID=652834 RepID=A0A7S3GJ72_9EUKA|mmetsp:Transcript_5776/g.13566  ORF Transcript_5776/g.13566 Transcript_5776/m.13566 type:complete len:1202 (+) Transcript_5776:73-3678(+)
MGRPIFSLFPTVFTYRASQNPLGKIRQAILYAIEQAIQREEGEVNATSVLGGLITALATQAAEIKVDLDTPACIAYLIHEVLPQVSPQVLKAKYDTCLDVLLGAASVFNESTACTRSIFLGVGFILSMQDAKAFEVSGLHRAFVALVEASSAQSPKVRKAALEGVQIATSNFQPDEKLPLPLVTSIIDGSKKSLTAAVANKNDHDKATAAVRSCLVLREVMKVMPEEHTRPVCVQLLAVATGAMSPASAAAMEVLSRFCYVSSSSKSPIFGQLLKALLELNAEFFADVYVSAAYVELLASAYAAFLASKQDAAIEKTSTVVSNILRFLENAGVSTTFQRRNLDVDGDTKSQSSLGLSISHAMSIVVDASFSRLSSSEGGESVVGQVISLVLSCMKPGYGIALQFVFSIAAHIGVALGRHRGEHVEPLLTAMADLRGLAEQSDSLLRAYDENLKTFIGGVGPETVVSVFGLVAKDQRGDIDTDALIQRSWMLPILAKGIKVASLKYFGTFFLPLATKLRHVILNKVETGYEIEAKNLSIILHQLFFLFPSFCSFPVDVAASIAPLGQRIAPILQGDADAEVHDALCTGIAVLLQNQRNARDSQIFPAEVDPLHILAERNLTKADEAAQQSVLTLVGENIASLQQVAKNFLPLLLERAVNKERQCVRAKEAVEAYLMICKPDIIAEYFTSLMKKLLAQDSADKDSLHINADVALAFIPAISVDAVKLLFRVIKVLIMNGGDGAAQKRAYKMIAKIAEREGGGQEYLDNVVGELHALLVQSSALCAAAGRRHRLNCIGQLVDTTVRCGGDPEFLVRSFAPEVMLSLKEANTKARNAAVAVLFEFVRAYEVWFGGDEGILRLIQILLAGLAGTTTRMVGATLEALGRILHKKRKARTVFASPQIIESGLILLRHRAREVVKAAVVFIRVIVSIMRPSDLESYVPAIVNALFADDTFEARAVMKTRIRTTLAKLVKKYSFEMVAQHVSAEHLPLLQYVRKMVAKDEKKRQIRQEGQKSSDDDSDGEDFDRLFVDEGEGVSEQNEEEMDFMMPMAARQRKERKGILSASNPFDEGDIDVDDDGRLVIDEKRMEKQEKVARGEFDSDDDDVEDGDRRGKVKGIPKRGDGINKSNKAKESVRPAGHEYRSKKAVGDMKKTGKLDPYAYVPLDRQVLNPRVGKKAAKGIRNVVKAAKKGATNHGKRKGKK